MNIYNFKDIHKRKRAWIIGNGPSLNKLDLSKLEGEITFGCNRIYLTDKVKPTYYAVEDQEDIRQFYKEFNAYDVPKQKFYPHKFSRSVSGDNVTYLDFIYDYRPYPRFIFKDEDEALFYWGGTVAYLLIQLAYWMGCDPIILIGFDHDWGYFNKGGKTVTSKEDDKYHFSNKYYGEGLDWRPPDMVRMEKAYTKAKEVLESKGYHIFNATHGGKLEIFDRINYDLLV